MMNPSIAFLSRGQKLVGSQFVKAKESWDVAVTIHDVDVAHGYLCGLMESMNVPSEKTPIITFWEGEIIDNKKHSFWTDRWSATQKTDLQHWARFPAFAKYEKQLQEENQKLKEKQRHMELELDSEDDENDLDKEEDSDIPSSMDDDVEPDFDYDDVDEVEEQDAADKKDEEMEEVNSDINHVTSSEDAMDTPPSLSDNPTSMLDDQFIFMRWKEKFFVDVGPNCRITIAGFYYICFDRKDGTVDGCYYDPMSSPFQKLSLKATSPASCGFVSPDFSFA